MMGVPLPLDGGHNGGLAFYYRQRRQFSADEIELARALGYLSKAALRTADLHGEQIRREQQALFLAQAASALASSLDYIGTLKAVAQIAVPQIADWCVVDVVNAAGELEHLALAHVDPDRVTFAREFIRRFPPDPAAPTGQPQVVRTGEPFLLPHLTDEMIAAGARSPEHAADIRALAITSYMVVPLRTRHGVAGAMTFVSAESGAISAPPTCASPKRSPTAPRSPSRMRRRTKRRVAQTSSRTTSSRRYRTSSARRSTRSSATPRMLRTGAVPDD